MRKPRLESEAQHSLHLLHPILWWPNSLRLCSKLDPCEWRSEGSQESYDGWFALMMACKAAGIAREDWLEWCALDECYADAGDEVGRKWDGAPARHADALFKALRDSWAQ